mmetsp:Transcript_38325/g.105746  ORF Transcript_38325/g.105746 Transcript_38325/m.105746 type:complete len:209 (-) Transcript_38325:369-995(-)
MRLSLYDFERLSSNGPRRKPKGDGELLAARHERLHGASCQTEGCAGMPVHSAAWRRMRTRRKRCRYPCNAEGRLLRRPRRSPGAEQPRQRLQPPRPRWARGSRWRGAVCACSWAAIERRDDHTHPGSRRPTWTAIERHHDPGMGRRWGCHGRPRPPRPASPARPARRPARRTAPSSHPPCGGCPIRSARSTRCSTRSRRTGWGCTARG